MLPQSSMTNTSFTVQSRAAPPPKQNAEITLHVNCSYAGIRQSYY